MNDGNLVQGVNNWAVSFLRYSAAFVRWRKCMLQSIGKKPRKLFTIYGGLPPISDFDRFHIHRKDERRDFIY